MHGPKLCDLCGESRVDLSIHACPLNKTDCVVYNHGMIVHHIHNGITDHTSTQIQLTLEVWGEICQIDKTTLPIAEFITTIDLFFDGILIIVVFLIIVKSVWCFVIGSWFWLSVIQENQLNFFHIWITFCSAFDHLWFQKFFLFLGWTLKITLKNVCWHSWQRFK